MSKISVFYFCLVVLIGITQEVLCDNEPLHTKPLYQYRYQTEDMMKTSASSRPVRGYHVVEGGYYPEESGSIGSGQYYRPIGHNLGYGGAGIGLGSGGAGIGFGAGLGGYGIGPGGFGGAGFGLEQPIGYQPQFIGGGGIGAAGLGGYISPAVHHNHHGYGGEEVDKSEFNSGKKNVEDVKFEKAHGKKGEEVNHGQQGYSHGGQTVQDAKGENGYYSNAAGGKKIIEDGKQYNGGENFNQEGKNEAENKLKKGHKKGHVIKGFKSSHHKDETGKTEEYYDEEHDEGDNVAFNGQSGAFGQKGQSSYKGGHEDGKFNEQEHKKSGHVSNQYAVSKETGDKGNYGENKYAGGGSVFGVNNGIDQQSLLGHQENSRFFKHHPVPFYHH
ncbi:unnamed protein product [Ceutorhynchus assimilis]|uniref:Uncharacterized protein n=1 Tax=Ceutorhynchus assimilis TaxID=467358 RepID=A0A9N9N0R2_9CUCU|nr:unnamed protein product [Ceutorhynchus assimilis]